MTTLLARASTLLVLGLALRAAAGTPSIRVRPLAAPAFPVARVVAGPGGTFTCLDWKMHKLRVISARGADAKVDLAIPAAAQITNIGGGDGQTVVTTAQQGTFVLGTDGSVRARFAATRFTPYVAATSLRNAAFGMGTAGDEDGRMRNDWLVTRVDLDQPSASPRELITDDAFADPFARSLYPLGYLLISADGTTLYALWEGSPVLHVAPMTSGAPRSISLTRGADAPPQATPALRAAAMTDRNSFYQLRSRFRWPQGLFRGPNDSVAVLFREPASRGNAFTVDVYSRDGKKIGANVPLDLEPRSASAHARVVTASDGRQYVLVNEPNNDASGVQNQHLYAIDMSQ